MKFFLHGAVIKKGLYDSNVVIHENQKVGFWAFIFFILRKKVDIEIVAYNKKEDSNG